MMSKLWVENWFQSQFLENSFHSFENQKKKKKDQTCPRRSSCFLHLLIYSGVWSEQHVKTRGIRLANFNSQESGEVRIDFTRRMLADLTAQISSNLQIMFQLEKKKKKRKREPKKQMTILSDWVPYPKKVIYV